MKNTSPHATPQWPSDLRSLIEESLDRFLPTADTQPESLHRAMRYAVFSGGKRVRPQLLLKVVLACGGGVRKEEQELALRAACAIELIHVASLVHDDLPCFDDAAMRRGRPTVHSLFGEAQALLVGDALLARGFELLTAAPRSLLGRAMRVMQLLAVATGSTSGLIGGQGLEEDGGAQALAPESAASYHAMKTGALFAMAAEAAAVTSGLKKTEPWAGVGRLIGKGYQLVHAATVLSASNPPTAQRPEDHVRAQLGALYTLLRERVLGISGQPEPLLAYLDELCSPLIPKGELLTAQGETRLLAEER
jgi:geranylgeranyl pyrophosphate synthase